MKQQTCSINIEDYSRWIDLENDKVKRWIITNYPMFRG